MKTLRSFAALLLLIPALAFGAVSATPINVLQFGADPTCAGDTTAAVTKAFDAANANGGGTVYFPPGTYCTTTGFILGNGSNSANTTKHNKVVIEGAGMGSSAGVTNSQNAGATILKYTGTTSGSAAVVTIAGPIYGIGIENMQIDANAKAGIGVQVIHTTASTFRKVSVSNATVWGWYLTTRTGFPSGVAFGNADNRFYDCYYFIDNATIGTGTASGIAMTSGVSSAVSLAGNPDSARNIWIGGTFMYGQSATSYGTWLNGADNNTMMEVQLYPYAGTTSGKDVYFQQWAASGNFPLENTFINLGMTVGISGNGGVGSSWGNTFSPLATSDGAPLPTITGVSAVTHLGQAVVQGVRAYRGRQIGSAKLNNSVQSNSTTSAVDVPGLAVTLTTPTTAKLHATFSGRCAKASAGTGFFTIAIGGSAQGETKTDVAADGTFHACSADTVIDVGGAGAQAVTVQFTSSDTNAVQISHGTLVVEELY